MSARRAGLLTSGLMEHVLLVGPMLPATNRGLSGVSCVYRSASCRANLHAARFICRQ